MVHLLCENFTSTAIENFELLLLFGHHDFLIFFFTLLDYSDNFRITEAAIRDTFILKISFK